MVQRWCEFRASVTSLTEHVEESLESLWRKRTKVRQWAFKAGDVSKMLGHPLLAWCQWMSVLESNNVIPNCVPYTSG